MLTDEVEWWKRVGGVEKSCPTGPGFVVDERERGEENLGATRGRRILY